MANQIVMMVMILVFGITTGTMALVACACGPGDAAAASPVLRRSLLLALLHLIGGRCRLGCPAGCMWAARGWRAGT